MMVSAPTNSYVDNGIPYTLDLSVYGLGTDHGSRPLYSSWNKITDISSGTDKLGSTPISMDNSGAWQTVNITFTATKNYEVFMIGGENAVSSASGSPNMVYTLIDSVSLCADSSAKTTTAIPSINPIGLLVLISLVFGGQLLIGNIGSNK